MAGFRFDQDDPNRLEGAYPSSGESSDTGDVPPLLERPPEGGLLAAPGAAFGGLPFLPSATERARDTEERQDIARAVTGDAAIDTKQLLGGEPLGAQGDTGLAKKLVDTGTSNETGAVLNGVKLVANLLEGRMATKGLMDAHPWLRKGTLSAPQLAAVGNSSVSTGLGIAGGVLDALKLGKGFAELQEGLATKDPEKRPAKLFEAGTDIVGGGAGVAQTVATVAGAGGVANAAGGVGGAVNVVTGIDKAIHGKDEEERGGGIVDAYGGGLSVAGAVAGGTAAPITAAASAGLGVGKVIGKASADVADAVSEKQGYFGKDPFTNKNLTSTQAAALTGLETKDKASAVLDRVVVPDAVPLVGGLRFSDGAVDNLAGAAGHVHGTAAALKNAGYTLGRRGWEKLKKIL